MCIAILNTKKTTLSKEILRNCWENNGDGAGILYINNDKMQIFKEMKSFDNFYDNYIQIKNKYGKKNMVLHFRISTHGKVNKTNCHPFLVNEDLGFVHNGMIYDVPVSKDYSDTYMFNESILKEFKSGFEYNDTIMDMLEFFIGKGSKLIFLNKNNHYKIVNESAGHWSMGCWFSNSSYKQVNNYVDFGGTKVYKSNYGTFASTYNSANVYGKQYSWNDTWEDEEDTQLCTNCDIKLYGINELNNKKCDFCFESDKALAESNDNSVYGCDCCDRYVVSKYKHEYNCFICDDCSKEWGLGA